MAKIFGKEMTKSEILERVGDIEQIAQITSMELKEGDASGVRALDVRNGSGLRFLVVTDRGLDITTAEFNGIPLTIRFHPGEMRPNFHEDLPLAFIKSWAGGLVTTCGLTQVGDPGKDGIENLVQHGDFTHISAKNVQYDGLWEDDEYRLQIRGRITEGALFYPSMELRRKITTYLGSNKFLIEDEVENVGYRKAPFMLMYHCNFGFPLIDTSSEIFMKSNSVEVKDDCPAGDADDWNKITEPQRDYENRVYYHDVEPDSDGYCRMGIMNNNIFDGKKLKLTMKYKKEQMPIVTEWKRMDAGEYVIGLEPGNCHSEGRIKEREVFKTLKYLEPGEIRNFELDFEVELI
jgi:galactose mutarotase-like enzyme